MNDESLPVACSLGADDLQRRFDEIAAVGSGSLTGADRDGDSQVLRFRRDTVTRQRLEEIVAAESKCCAFLELDLGEKGEELVLRISAPGDGAAVAKEFARAFGSPR